MRGRKPESSSRLRVKGNPGRKHLKNQPNPPAAKTFRCPGWMGKHGRDLWKKIAPELLAAGVLTEWDRSGFETMCSAYHLMRLSEAELSRDGLTVRDERGGIKKHPASAIYKANADLYGKFAEQFGLSPISRRRLDIQLEQKDELDEFLGF